MMKFYMKCDCGCCLAELMFESKERAQEAVAKVGYKNGAVITDDAGQEYSGLDTFYGIWQDGEPDRGLSYLAEKAMALADKVVTEATLDKDGYPTEETLAVIRKWPTNNLDGLMEFMRSIWRPKDWIRKDSDGEWHVYTAGWSGNEDMLDALQENHAFWKTYWQSSKRGGHHIFWCDACDGSIK